MKKIFALLMLLLISCKATALDIAPYEQSLKEANSYFEQALTIAKEKGHGGFMREHPYKKEMDEAMNRYLNIINALDIKALLRKDIAERLDTFLSFTAQMQSEYLDEVAATELAILPQVLFRSAAMTYDDINGSNDLFLPSPLTVPENQRAKYAAALAETAVTAAETTTNAGPVQSSFDSGAFPKESYYKMLESQNTQIKYVNSMLSGLSAKIKELAGNNSAASQFDLGNAYLMQAFYKRLGDCSSLYLQAKAFVPKITYTPLYVELVTFRSRVAKVQIPTELPENIGLKIEDAAKYKDKATALIECCKIPLPPDFTEEYYPNDSDAQSKISDQIGRYEKPLADERSAAFNKFESMTTHCFNFNLFDIPENAVSAFSQAVSLDQNNAHYHIRLGNIYRLKALSNINAILSNANYYMLGREWNNAITVSYKPRDENAALDLSTAKFYLEKAKAEYSTAQRISPALGNRAFGIYYLGLVNLDPSLAASAVNMLSSSANDDSGFLALEYAYYLLDKAQNEQKFALGDAFKNSSALAFDTFNKISGTSPLKWLGASVLSEDSFSWVMAKMRAGGKTEDTYDECIAKIEQAKAVDSDNPYLYLSQGYLYFMKGTKLGPLDAIAIVAESIGMGVSGIVLSSNLYADMQRIDEVKYKASDFEKYAAEEGARYEEKIKMQMGQGNDMIVRKYDPNDFIKAVEVLKTVNAKFPDISLTYYYLGKVYTILGLYYSAIKDDAQARTYSGLAKEAFKQFIKSS